MKKLTVMAASLGWDAVERNKATRMAGLEFESREGVFPGVTCVAQATLRTGLSPAEHGMWCNGAWIEPLRKPLFWEQSSALVKGRRTWEERRAAGATVGMFFFQQSLGESVDAWISPAPVHKHGGGMVMACSTKPADAAAALEKCHGKFPLWRYWGPLASPKAGAACIDWFETFTAIHDVDEAYLYLPTLDYAAQKHGPGSRADNAAFAHLRRQLERLAALCDARGAELSVQGDYAIAPVTQPPVAPNAVLRREGLFRTRTVAGMAYPDFHQSAAFAMCDHELCILCGQESEKAKGVLMATGDYEDATVAGGPAILLAKEGSWCDYRWWTKKSEAPDFASHVDIHNKPGFDPRELFFFCRGLPKGTHGRSRPVAASLTPTR